ncbi:MAG: hypothetical protein D8M59_13155 [Planctomycetes bacterium]|nr:hypothetical protein [Planctomycetota bacterium]
MAVVAGLGALIAALSREDLSYHEVNSLASVCYLTLSQCWLPLGWMAAAAGFGVWLASILVPSATSDDSGPWEWAVAAGLGTAAMLWLDRLCGALGWLQAAGGIGAWAVLIVGWGLLACRLVIHRGRGRRNTSDEEQAGSGAGSVSWVALLLPAVPALAVLVVACCSIPGWLWDSEFAGYDVLEYHLQLPAEWLAAGRILPPAHNVYGHLPSYVESAYYHLAVLYSTLPDFVVEPEPSAVQLNAAVHAAIACQMLHGLMLLAAAGAVARLVRVCLQATVDSKYAGVNTARVITACAFAITISVPWTIVVGTMAYNEMAVVLFLALGLSIIVKADYRDTAVCLRVGAALGLLTGAACGAKLTSAGFVAAPLLVTYAIALVSGFKRDGRHWGAMAGRSAACGGAALATALLMLAPWLVQNALVTGGNPVFPFATSLFGTGEWSTAQVQRWDEAHMVLMPFAERMARVWGELIVHRQYAGLWVLGIAGLIGVWWRFARSERGRRVGVTLTSTVVLQVGFWMTATHLESRFLIPAVVPLVAAVSFALLGLSRYRRVRLAVCCVIPLALGSWTVLMYLGQQEGRPASLIDGVGLRSGSGWQALTPDKQTKLAAVYHEGFLNLALKQTDTLYLIGDATPFYINSPKIIWNTTWDQSLLGQAIESAPDDPSAWASYLDSQGVDYLLVNFAELHRLTVVDGWYDERVTIEDVRRLVQDHGRALMSWPDEEPVRFLYRLRLGDR